MTTVAGKWLEISTFRHLLCSSAELVSVQSNDSANNCHICFDHGVIHIVKQLTQSRGEGHPFAFGTLKNGKTRSINPAPFVLETLKAHKEYQEEQKRMAGDLWNEGKL